MVALNYEERMAVQTIRRSMRTKPEIMTALLEGATKESIGTALINAQKELTALLAAAQALQAAAKVLIDAEKSSKAAQDVSTQGEHP